MHIIRILVLVLEFLVFASPVYAEVNISSLSAKINNALGTKNVQIQVSYLKKAALYLKIQTQSPKHVIHFVSLKLKDPSVDLVFSNCGARKIPTAWARQNNAFLAINGNFFPGTPEAPRGIVVSKGVPCAGNSDPTPDTNPFPYLGCSRTKFCWIEKNPLALKRADLFNAVAGQYFVEEGKVRANVQGNTKINPRTLVGIRPGSHNLFFMVIEGRRPSQKVYGMGGEDAAELMILFGADKAMNLDGGGSSAMVIEGALVNQRPENELKERGVANLFGAVWK